MKTVERITSELWREFGNRKQKGRLDLVYNIGSEKFYPVPRELEHKDFMPNLEGLPEENIPVQIRTSKQGSKIIVTDLLVGASSYESECGVRHPQAYLTKAYERALILLNRDKYFKISPEARLKIYQTFSQN